MRDFATQVPNTDGSDLIRYPDKRIKDNTGAGDGTPVNELVYGDLMQFILKAKRLYGITPTGQPDNEANGFQILEAVVALASKNDFVLPITNDSGVLSVPVKLSLMLTNEQIVCKSAINYASQTQIKGSNGVVLTVTVQGSFKTNEYVRLIRTSGGITLVRLTDSVNFDTVATENGYLKKATQSEENAGTIDTKATTPLVNKTTFGIRVNGADSDTYLAVPTGAGQQNGLMSHEDKFKLDNFESSVKNYGYFSGVNIGSPSGSPYPCVGDVTSATAIDSSGGNQVIRVVVQNELGGLNYFVRISIQSMSADIRTDKDIKYPVFNPVNATTFDICISESDADAQNLRFHIETVKY